MPKRKRDVIMTAWPFLECEDSNSVSRPADGRRTFNLRAVLEGRKGLDDISAHTWPCKSWSTLCEGFDVSE